mmetsp:Transcript_18927/g.45342  ORF Transcript_18927/g.45342 Transcript_18927/m.45342 type:complete len:240 (-) Transcript_18927:59-778(-)
MRWPERWSLIDRFIRVGLLPYSFGGRTLRSVLLFGESASGVPWTPLLGRVRRSERRAVGLHTSRLLDLLNLLHPIGVVGVREVLVLSSGTLEALAIAKECPPCAVGTSLARGRDDVGRLGLDVLSLELVLQTRVKVLPLRAHSPVIVACARLLLGRVGWSEWRGADGTLALLIAVATLDLFPGRVVISIKESRRFGEVAPASCLAFPPNSGLHLAAEITIVSRGSFPFELVTNGVVTGF